MQQVSASAFAFAWCDCGSLGQKRMKLNVTADVLYMDSSQRTALVFLQKGCLVSKSAAIRQGDLPTEDKNSEDVILPGKCRQRKTGGREECFG